ncbi:MAG: DUF3365 domain-containing protein [Catalinimonas sp.]
MRYAIFLPLLALIAACNQKPADLAAARDEMRAREVIHASQGDITQAAYDIGRAQVDALEKAWFAQISAALDTTSPDRALDACRLDGLKTYAVFTEGMEARVERIARHPFMAVEIDDPKARALLDAYLYGAATDAGDNVQRLDEDRTLLYTRPITFSDAACLRCHGTVGEEVDPATYAAIRRHYPNADTLQFGGKLDSLAGVWALFVPKRRVVLSLGDE